MRVYCRKCNLQLSNPLTELIDLSLINEGDQKDYIPVGYALYSNGNFFTGSKGKLIINLNDLLNTNNHPDHKRLNGCCGMDGMDGLNKVCLNGHEIGTSMEDCWMPHCIILEPNQIRVDIE